MARHGMIAAAHPLTVAAGLRVLQDGGNALDAAIAAGLTATVVMPEMCGLGGDLFAIVHAPGQAPVTVLGAGVAPRAATLEQMRAAGPQTPSGPKMPTTGPLSIGTPGMIDGYDPLLKRFGSRSFASLATDAIRHAEEGVPMTPMCQAATVLHQVMLARNPDIAALLLPGGKPMAVGDILRQPGLARTLKRLASDGLADFYKGETARSAPMCRRLAGR